jgi:hypothetical protein
MKEKKQSARPLALARCNSDKGFEQTDDVTGNFMMYRVGVRGSIPALFGQIIGSISFILRNRLLVGYRDLNPGSQA